MPPWIPCHREPTIPSAPPIRLPPDAAVSHSLEMMAKVGLAPEEDTLIVALTYRCNSACTFCIIATEIGQGLPDAPDEVLEAVFRFNAEHRRFRRLTFSGAEVTLRPDLPAIARRATTEGGFEVVRIQTNARRLADRAYCAALIAAGVREFFVSIHGHRPELDRAITLRAASFAQAAKGVRVALELGAEVWSNTVICARNVDVLPEIVGYLHGLGIRRIQLWSFLEVGDPSQVGEHVRLARAMPRVREALDRAEALGLEAVVKWLPRCLLGRHGHRLDNHQPHMVIRDEFQERLAGHFGFGCVHRGCRWLGRGCDGLHEGYVARFGDERELLEPEDA